MRNLLFSLATFLVLSSTVAAAPNPRAAAAPGAKPKMRTFLDCKGLPRESLKNSVSPKFYKSLTISPLEAYVVARAPIFESKAAGARIIHSEAGGMWDQPALALANSMEFSGMNRVESRIGFSHVDVHLLVYKIADGLMVVGFSHISDPKYADYKQYGRATIGFLQNGKWTFMDNKLRR